MRIYTDPNDLSNELGLPAGCFDKEAGWIQADWPAYHVQDHAHPELRYLLTHHKAENYFDMSDGPDGWVIAIELTAEPRRRTGRVIQLTERTTGAEDKVLIDAARKELGDDFDQVQLQRFDDFFRAHGVGV